MLRVLDISRQGVRADGSELGPPPAGVVRWVDLQKPTSAQLSELRDAFAFDSLAIADCEAYGLLSKVDDYTDYLFAVLHALHVDPNDRLEIAAPEVHVFLARDYLVTVHDDALPELDAVWQRVPTDAKIVERRAGWIAVQLVQSLAGAIEILVERLGDAADAIERDAIAGGQVDLAGMLAVKRSAALMHRVLRPMRDALTVISRHTEGLLEPRSITHMRDLSDWVMRLDETIVAAKDSVSAAITAHHTLLATRTNDTMKKLTVFSAVFLPLSIIVGFWGQNFTFWPFGTPAAYAVMLASVIALPIGILLWVKRWL